MKCENCGEELWEQAVVCPTCSIVVKRSYPEDELQGEAAPTREEEPDPFGDLPASRTLTLSSAAKKWILAVMAVIALGFAAYKYTGFASGPNQSSPERAVRGFLDAAMKEDAKRMVSYLLIDPESPPQGEDRDSLIEMYKKLFAEQHLEIEKYKIVRTNVEERSATVSYTMQAKINGMDSGSADDESRFNLQKVEDKWYIAMQ